jgi:hypothetical protein
MSTAVPKDIITAAESGKWLVDNWGILGAAMNEKQKAVLHTLSGSLYLTWNIIKRLLNMIQF